MQIAIFNYIELHTLFQTGKIRAKQNDRAHAGYLASLCMKVITSKL